MRVMQIPKELTEEQIKELKDEYGIKVFSSAYAAYVYEEVAEAYEDTIFTYSNEYKELFESNCLNKDEIVDEVYRLTLIQEDEIDAMELCYDVKQRLDKLQFKALAESKWSKSGKYYSIENKELDKDFPYKHSDTKINLYDEAKELITDIKPTDWLMDAEDAAKTLSEAGLIELI